MSLVRKKIDACCCNALLFLRDHTSDQLVYLCSKTLNQFKRVLGLDPELGAWFHCLWLAEITIHDETKGPNTCSFLGWAFTISGASCNSLTWPETTQFLKLRKVLLQ